MGMSAASFAVSELSEVVNRCNPSFDLIGPISWRLRGSARKSWVNWLDLVFEPVLLPHLWYVLDYAYRQSANEIIALDAELGKQLDVWSGRRSIEAGRTLIQQRAPRSDRVIGRFRAAISRGDASGHFSTVYAVRCGLFSIPVRTALLSYALQELAAADPQENGRLALLEMAAEPINEFLRTLSDSRRSGLCFHG
jgi:hypothetical protein